MLRSTGSSGAGFDPDHLLPSLDEEPEAGGEVISSWAVEIERRARQVVDGSGEDWDVARDRIAGQLRNR